MHWFDSAVEVVIKVVNQIQRVVKRSPCGNCGIKFPDTELSAHGEDVAKCGDDDPLDNPWRCSRCYSIDVWRRKYEKAHKECCHYMAELGGRIAAEEKAKASPLRPTIIQEIATSLLHRPSESWTSDGVTTRYLLSMGQTEGHKYELTIDGDLLSTGLWYFIYDSGALFLVLFAAPKKGLIIKLQEKISV